MIVTAIVAMDRAGLIGDGATMPWHLPRDLKRFRTLTLGKPVIMGRRTFESLGRPLPGRLNIILTRNNTLQAEGCQVARSIDEALAIAANAGANEAMIIGGGEVYHATIGLWDRLLLTVVEGSFQGNVHFPIEAAAARSWRPTSQEAYEADARNPYPHRFIALERLQDQPDLNRFELKPWLDEICVPHP